MTEHDNADEVTRLRAEVEDLRASLAELAPSDEVLVEGSYFQRADLPRILRNYMRSSAEHAREAKAEFIKRQSSEAALARVRDVALIEDALASVDWSLIGPGGMASARDAAAAAVIHFRRAALDPATPAVRPVSDSADAGRAGSAPSEGHSEAQGALVESCSPECAPHLAQFCSPDCEKAANHG